MDDTDRNPIDGRHKQYKSHKLILPNEPTSRFLQSTERLSRALPKKTLASGAWIAEDVSVRIGSSSNPGPLRWVVLCDVDMVAICCNKVTCQKQPVRHKNSSSVIRPLSPLSVLYCSNSWNTMKIHEMNGANPATWHTWLHTSAVPGFLFSSPVHVGDHLWHLPDAASLKSH